MYVVDMEADPQYDGIGPGPNPIPTPGECPFCDVECMVAERLNDNTDAIITTFEYECPECESRWIDRP